MDNTIIREVVQLEIRNQILKEDDIPSDGEIAGNLTGLSSFLFSLGGMLGSSDVALTGGTFTIYVVGSLVVAKIAKFITKTLIDGLEESDLYESSVNEIERDLKKLNSFIEKRDKKILQLIKDYKKNPSNETLEKHRSEIERLSDKQIKMGKQLRRKIKDVGISEYISGSDTNQQADILVAFIHAAEKGSVIGNKKLERELGKYAKDIRRDKGFIQKAKQFFKMGRSI